MMDRVPGADAPGYMMSPLRGFLAAGINPAARIEFLRDVEQLRRHVEILNDASWFRYGQTVFAESFKMQIDCLA